MKNNLIYGLYFLMSAVLLTGCESFEDTNTNPNVSVEVTPGMLATGLLTNITRNGSTSNYAIGNSHVYWLHDNMCSKELYWLGVGDLDKTYNNLGRADFDPLTVLNNIPSMIEFAGDNEAVVNSYRALGHFVRVYIFYHLTMKVGDIPYSEAVQGDDGVYYPKYDRQKDVFIGLLNELDEADRLFASGASFDGDILYGGDPARWRKAVNVLQLRLLVSLSNRAGDSDLNVGGRFQTIVNSRPLFASNADNCQLVYEDRAGMKFPFYKENNNSEHFCHSSSVVVDTLKRLRDRRLFYFAAPTAQSVSSGVPSSDWEAYIGVDPSNTVNDIQVTVTAGQASRFNLRYYELPDCEPHAILSYAEQQFMLAEAAARGWIGGNAQAYYEEGIRAAMTFTAENTPDNPDFHHNMKITESYIDAYLQEDRVRFPANVDEQLHHIMIQKFLGNFLQSPWMSFYECRRTGIPALPVNPLSNLNVPGDRMPVRWMYPQVEYNVNSENVEAAIAAQFNGIDDNNGLIWLLQE
jgi:hypothetical protein